MTTARDRCISEDRFGVRDLARRAAARASPAAAASTSTTYLSRTPGWRATLPAWIVADAARAEQCDFDHSVLPRGHRARRFIACQHPFVRRIVLEMPFAPRPRHHVQVIRFVAVGHDDRMVAARHHHDVVILDGQRFVERAVVGVDALEREALRRIAAGGSTSPRASFRAAGCRCRACAADSSTSARSACALRRRAGARPARSAEGCRRRSASFAPLPRAKRFICAGSISRAAARAAARARWRRRSPPARARLHARRRAVAAGRPHTARRRRTRSRRSPISRPASRRAARP